MKALLVAAAFLIASSAWAGPNCPLPLPVNTTCGWADDTPIPVNTPEAAAYNAKLTAAMVSLHAGWDCRGRTVPLDQCRANLQAAWRTAINQAGAAYFGVTADTVTIAAARAAVFKAAGW